LGWRCGCQGVQDALPVHADGTGDRQRAVPTTSGACQYRVAVAEEAKRHVEAGQKARQVGAVVLRVDRRVVITKEDSGSIREANGKKMIIGAQIKRAVGYAMGSEGIACTTEAGREIEKTQRLGTTSGGGEGDVTYVW
jgi:hypothetical protein